MSKFTKRLLEEWKHYSRQVLAIIMDLLLGFVQVGFIIPIIISILVFNHYDILSLIDLLHFFIHSMHFRTFISFFLLFSLFAELNKWGGWSVVMWLLIIFIYLFYICSLLLPHLHVIIPALLLGSEWYHCVLSVVAFKLIYDAIPNFIVSFIERRRWHCNKPK